jgi:hypothetical protein
MAALLGGREGTSRRSGTHRQAARPPEGRRQGREGAHPWKARIRAWSEIVPLSSEDHREARRCDRGSRDIGDFSIPDYMLKPDQTKELGARPRNPGEQPEQTPVEGPYSRENWSDTNGIRSTDARRR